MTQEQLAAMAQQFHTDAERQIIALQASKDWVSQGTFAKKALVALAQSNAALVKIVTEAIKGPQS